MPRRSRSPTAITPEYRRLIEASPFAALATSGPEGLDCSPRGDAAGFVRIHDDKTLMMPDRRGNNRVDSLRNIVRDPRVALLFLLPGFGSTLRINGRAHVSVDAALANRFAVEARRRARVVVMTIDEVYFQCARAIVRSDLWNPAKHSRAQDPADPGPNSRQHDRRSGRRRRVRPRMAGAGAKVALVERCASGRSRRTVHRLLCDREAHQHECRGHFRAADENARRRLHLVPLIGLERRAETAFAEALDDRVQRRREALRARRRDDRARSAPAPRRTRSSLSRSARP